MERYDMFEPDDLVSWMDPNDELKVKVCRIKFIHDFGGEIMDNTIITIQVSQTLLQGSFSEVKMKLL